MPHKESGYGPDDGPPADYLPTPGPGMPAVPWEHLMAQKVPTIEVRKLQKGDWVYVFVNCDADDGDEHLEWGYLGKVIAVSTKNVRVHFTDSTNLTKVARDKDEVFADYARNVSRQVCIAQPPVSEAIPHQEPEEASKKADDEQIAKILRDKTLRRDQAGTEQERLTRARMILKAIKKAKSTEPDREWPQDEHELGEALTEYAKEAMAAAKKPGQHGADANELKLGTSAANCGIAARMFSIESSKSKENVQVTQLLKSHEKQLTNS